MTRYRYSPLQIIAAAGGGTPAALTLSPSAPFRIYPVESGGSPYTDLLASDASTALPVNGSGYPYCDLSGIPPIFYGPDTVNGVLWLDPFTGSRFPIYPADRHNTLLTTGVVTGNVTQALAGPTSFTHGSTPVAFSLTPTVAGSLMITAANLAAQFAADAVLIAWHNATGQPYFIYVNPSTGVWPNSGSRVTPAGGSLASLTAPLIWSSITWAGATKPTGLIDNDTWWERVS